VVGAMTFIIPRLFEVRMVDVTADIAITGALAAVVYAVAAFAQLIVGRMVDKHPVKPILIGVATGQAALIFIMSTQVDYLLFGAALLAMAFVFGQIPITDAVLTRYVPDEWRAKVLSVKFLLNLGVGAVSLLIARTILAGGGGFETVVLVLAIGACCIVLGAILLPARTGMEAAPASAPAE
jgi:MFS family permease